MAKFTQNAVWADTIKLMRTHWVALIAIAGVFNFLPTLLVNHFYPMPEPAADADLQLRFQQILNYYRDHSLVIVLESFVIMIGSAAMMRLVFARSGTVGGALLFAITLLPAYSTLIVLANIAIGAGFMLFIVPGLYLWGRLIPAAPAMVAEERRNPIDALKRGWALSEGHAWLTVGLVLLVTIAAGILILAISLVAGIAFKAAAGPELGALLEMIVLCAMQAVAAALSATLSAAIYRALAPPRPEA